MCATHRYTRRVKDIVEFLRKHDPNDEHGVVRRFLGLHYREKLGIRGLPAITPYDLHDLSKLHFHFLCCLVAED